MNMLEKYAAVAKKCEKDTCYQVGYPNGHHAHICH